MVKALGRLAACAAMAALIACGGGGGTPNRKGQTVPLQVTQTSLPDGTVSATYHQNLTVTGGAAPFTWVVSAGALPNGVTLANTGVISGIPTQDGSFAFTVTVTDPNNDSGTANLTIRISASGFAPITITTPTLPDGKIAAVYQQVVTATGGTPPYSWTLIGSLPPGLSLSADGVISGTPTQTGQFIFTLKVTDALGQTQSGSFTLNITS